MNRDPIGETGGLNLYEFVGNRPTNAIDLLGMQGAEGAYWDYPTYSSKCTLSYSFDTDEAWWERIAYRPGTKWIDSLEDVQKDMLQRRSTCCCFKEVIFTQHNGVPGTLTLADGMVSSAILKSINNEALKRRSQIL